MPSVLVVDDELSIRESFSLILEGKYKVLLSASGEAALKIISDQKLDMVYLDIRMPGMDGLEALKRMKEIDPNLEIIMVTAVNDVQKAGEAIKYGARDYVVKPFDIDYITKLTEQILRKKTILAEGSEVEKRSGEKIPALVGQTEKIISISKIIAKIKRDARVLISGEAGTEKEMVAEIIHQKSDRRSFPFRAVYLSPEMSISEVKALLFGWEKGGSTVDLEAKSGVFEQAKNGTVFINHLESLPEEIFKDLSSLEFSRRGSTAKIPISVRLIGGANPPPAAKDNEVFKFFSEVHIQIPPLRDRSSDIPLLVDHFIEKYNTRYGKNIKINASALEALTNYSWPGNMQQLESLIERLLVSSAAEQISLEDLPFDILLESAGSSGSSFISTFEKEYIQAVFEQSGKNKEKTAALLKINPLLLETKL